MAYAKRRDNNHAEIRDYLRACGYFVQDLANVGAGFPDLLAVSKAGTIVLLEVKQPGCKLTEDEAIWHAIFPGPCFIVHSSNEAIQTMSKYDEVKS